MQCDAEKTMVILPRATPTPTDSAGAMGVTKMTKMDLPRECIELSRRVKNGLTGCWAVLALGLHYPPCSQSPQHPQHPPPHTAEQSSQVPGIPGMCGMMLRFTCGSWRSRLYQLRCRATHNLSASIVIRVL